MLPQVKHNTMVLEPRQKEEYFNARIYENIRPEVFYPPSRLEYPEAVASGMSLFGSSASLWQKSVALKIVWIRTTPVGRLIDHPRNGG